ncbi:hypothetical protein [Clostridium haemolyticum]|nr:hypothetical protein [Clostridium haemolyticum]
MNRGKVLIAERIDEAGVKLLQKEMDVDLFIGIKRDELLKKNS